MLPFNLRSNWSYCCSVGRCVQENLVDCDLTMTGSPCSILFPASHGFGLASTVLIQFLIDTHNGFVRKLFDSKLKTAAKKVDLAMVGCREIVDPSILVTVDAQV